MLVLCILVLALVYVLLVFQARTAEMKHRPWSALKAFWRRYTRAISGGIVITAFLALMMVAAYSGATTAVPDALKGFLSFSQSVFTNIGGAMSQYASDLADMLLKGYGNGFYRYEDHAAK